MGLRGLTVAAGHRNEDLLPPAGRRSCSETYYNSVSNTWGKFRVPGDVEVRGEDEYLPWHRSCRRTDDYQILGTHTS